MQIEETKGLFGFHLMGGSDQPLATNATASTEVRNCRPWNDLKNGNVENLRSENPPSR